MIQAVFRVSGCREVRKEKKSLLSYKDSRLS